MPAIRDGRGVLTVHDMGTPPPGSPSGPVVRVPMSEARMADFAAERAAVTRKPVSRSTPADLARSRANGASRAGFVKGATKPPAGAIPQEEPVPVPATAPPAKRRVVSTERRQRRLERVERYLAAIKASSSHREAAEALGVGKHSLEMFVSDLRRRGELPDDVEALLRERNPARRDSKAPGQTIGRPRRSATPAQDLSGESPIEGRQAGVPATDADERGTIGPGPATIAATLPGPAPNTGMLDAYFAPRSDNAGEAGGGPVEGEDRCSWARFLTSSTVLHLCDRAAGHEGAHRGRLYSVLVTAQKIDQLGHAVAAPA